MRERRLLGLPLGIAFGHREERWTVGVDVVRELYGVMAARGATGGFVVTSGRFTEEAVGFARGRNVTLVDGPKLYGLIRSAQSGAGLSQARDIEAAGGQGDKAPLPAATCPVCARGMVRRTARRGSNAGGEFWGCTAYPSCRGTRPIG